MELALTVLHHLELALTVLRNHQLFVKREKCQFGQRQVHYLGHVMSDKRIVMDQGKIATMVNWPKLATPKALRGFLGLTCYYHKFIKNYGKIVGLLTRMLKKDSFLWSPTANTAFQNLKSTMMQALVLALPNFAQKFIVECDASGSGVGAVLMQDRPIAFYS